MRGRGVAALAVTALGVVAVAGCGASSSSNGESKKNGPQVAADAAAALRKAGSVHVKGMLTQQGKPVLLDLRLRGADEAGSVTSNGVPAQFVLLGSKQYLKLPGSLYPGVSARVAAAVNNRWFCSRRLPPGWALSSSVSARWSKNWSTHSAPRCSLP